MRGSVSLAAALALPLTTHSGERFPDRNIIIFLTFAVIFATLVVQGLTLPALIRRLGVARDGSEDAEEIRARLMATKAALAQLDELEHEDWTREDTIERMRRAYEYRKRRVAARAGKIEDDGYEDRSLAYQQIVQMVLAAQRKARGRGAKAKLNAAAKLEELADRCEKVARQIKQRVAGDPIKDRIVSLFDPDARPIRKGKLGKPNEFGFVSQLAEVTENTKRGARGLILPASTEIGNPAEDTLLPGTVAELGRLGISVQESRARRWVQHRSHEHRARGPSAQTDIHRWPPGAGLQTHPTPAAALPNGRRGPDQSPQTPLRARPIPSYLTSFSAASRLGGSEDDLVFSLSEQPHTAEWRAEWFRRVGAGAAVRGGAGRRRGG
jgi:hypothetical protein